MRIGFWLFILVVMGLVGLLVIQFPFTANKTDAQIHTLYYLIWLIPMTAAAFMHYRGRSNEMLKHAASWLVIITLLVAGYTYRDVLLNNRIASALTPSRPTLTGSGSMVFSKQQDGHFYIDTKVNGASVRFMADTGATDIVLSPSDAKRAGYNIEDLAFTRAYQTANGIGAGAPIIIDRLKVGPFVLDEMPASVNNADMRHSLIGMTFFNTFSRIEVAGDQLILHP